MSEKTAPLGICDLCGETFPAGVSLYTKRGPRRYCSIECRNTANSRDGAEIRARKARERVARGEWENPSPFVREDATEAERHLARRKIGQGVTRRRRAEVRAGIWRNPALDDAAREKLSRPRAHADNPALHRAIERLRTGDKMSDLTIEEADAYRTWRRALRYARRDEVNAWYRTRYRRMCEDQERRRKTDGENVR